MHWGAMTAMAGEGIDNLLAGFDAVRDSAISEMPDYPVHYTLAIDSAMLLATTVATAVERTGDLPADTENTEVNLFLHRADTYLVDGDAQSQMRVVRKVGVAVAVADALPDRHYCRSARDVVAAPMRHARRLFWLYGVARLCRLSMLLLLPLRLRSILNRLD